MKRVFGVDPGLRQTGWSCIEVTTGARNAAPRVIEAGVIRLDAKHSISQRLNELHADLGALLDELVPEYVVVEKLYAHYKHPTTAIKMGHARGVILLAAQSRDIRIEELSATEIKKAIVGHGHASKQQIQVAVQSICRLKEPPSPMDVSDALAIAITGSRHFCAMTS